MEFSACGLAGASCETSAATVGISQPYLSKLYGIRNRLFLLALHRVLDLITGKFKETACRLPASVETLQALAKVYETLDGTEVLLVVQGFAACGQKAVQTEGNANGWLW